MERVLVVGVGGAGCSIAEKFGRWFGCSVLAVNLSREIEKNAGILCLPLELAGGRLSTVEAAVEDVSDRFREMLAGKQNIVLVVGLGGNTGSQAAPVLARIARSIGLRVTAVATLPFSFETERRTVSEAALGRLREAADALIIQDHAVESRSQNALQESLDEYFERVAKRLCAKLIMYNDIQRHASI